jgi:hypothetical protein
MENKQNWPSLFAALSLSLSVFFFFLFVLECKTKEEGLNEVSVGIGTIYLYCRTGLSISLPSPPLFSLCSAGVFLEYLFIHGFPLCCVKYNYGANK